MLSTTFLAALTASFGIVSCSPTHHNHEPVAQTKNGTYAGRYLPEYHQDLFLGIPYAQPPVGDLRFRNPASLDTSFDGVRDAKQFSSECYGYGSDQWNYQISEDCLYINVIRPAGYAQHEKLPVVFWIHGGGFYEGGGVDQRYNQSFTVQNSVKIGKPIIGVSINYRLATFGFLSGSQEVVDGGDLNLGLKDQRLALHWAQENIAAFGGDPTKITIQGESAGAGSVGFHITAYNGRDDKLFRGAIMQSGNPVNFGSLAGSLDNAPYYNELVRRTGCGNNQTTGSLECLRALPIDQLNTAINTTSPTINITTVWMPVVDGDFIAKRTSIQLAAGDFVKIPIISGANSDEGTAFSPQGIQTTDDFRAVLASTIKDNSTDLINDLLELYPDDTSVNVVASLGDARPGLPFGAQFRRSASYFGDYVFIAGRRLTCETWAAAGLPAYCYRFNAIPAGIPPQIAVTHFQEVSFAFLNIQGVGYAPAAEPPFTDKPASYARLAQFMNSNWVSFVHDLDPNSWRDATRKLGGSYWVGGEAAWPKYELGNPRDIVFDANVTSFAEADTFRKEGMALINAHALDAYQR